MRTPAILLWLLTAMLFITAPTGAMTQCENGGYARSTTEEKANNVKKTYMVSTPKMNSKIDNMNIGGAQQENSGNTREKQSAKKINRADSGKVQNRDETTAKKRLESNNKKTSSSELGGQKKNAQKTQPAKNSATGGRQKDK